MKSHGQKFLEMIRPYFSRCSCVQSPLLVSCMSVRLATASSAGPWVPLAAQVKHDMMRIDAAVSKL